ncbi:WXG100 family type VII secretion target [Nocardia brasiliensis]|uniref:WXG100 family type VII secretion target n=1 Tax=Nocardia brasiliensis TaxID=37326 RepID=UPI001895403B|nr:WXG100 family type VII secretion target [Nocardia brasiliensis]MBF6124812.1 WXG100 family type VII secretion target [Nocardia brasiliensis]
MDNTQPFQVKLADLEHITARLDGFIGFLSESLTGLQQRIDTVQQSWNGSTADAQSEAFRLWMTGATDVTEGITAMKQAAVDARDRYSSAAAANLRMLGRG